MVRRTATNALILATIVMAVVDSSVGQNTTETPWSDDSCNLRCDESYFPGRACYCNEACDQYENCCFDYYSICRPDFVWTDEWLKFDGHEYKYFADPHTTAEKASEQCQGQSGLLISIRNEQEADFVKLKVLRKRTLSVVIGGRDTGGDWMWPDGSIMPLPTEAWHLWYDGQPDNTDGTKGCSVLTNYMFWASPMFMIDRYIWRSFGCDINANIIQGYVCERTLLCEPNPCENNGTCMYIGGDREYHCQCQEGYVGNHCEYELIEDALWTDCGNINLVAGSDITTLTSPLYPQKYPPRARCEWHIQTEEGKTIQFDLEKLDIELGKDCVFDNLTIYDGRTSNSDNILMGPVCGNKEMLQANQLSSAFTSATNEVLVVFHTDQSLHQDGFALSYSEEMCGQGTGSSGCGTRGLFTAQCGSVLLEAGPEQSEDPCLIAILVPEGQLVNITFKEFNIFDSGKSCADGGMKLYDRSDDSADDVLIGTYCGFRFPWSVQSKSNHVILKLWGTPWEDGYRISADYTTIDATTWSQQAVGSSHMINLDPDVTHVLDTTTYIPNVRNKDKGIQKLSIRSKPGQKISVDKISGTWDDGDTVKVYDGVDASSQLLVDLDQLGLGNLTSLGAMVSTTFKIYVIVERSLGSRSGIQLTLRAIDYTPELSGCYRPYYSNKHNERYTALENHLVTSLKPVVLMVSQQSVGVSDPGYDEGLYCKWTIRGEAGKALGLSFLDTNILPLSEDCDHDGFIIYDGVEMYGPFCGSGHYNNIQTKTNEVQLIFYSDTGYQRRQNGALRLLIETISQSAEECPVKQMEMERSLKYQSDCGSVLSPNFPGMVPPGLWTWSIDGLDETQYFVIYVQYVRGPGVNNDCNQYLKLNELAQDSTVLKQLEGAILTVCGSTDLFVPKRRFKLPQYQKFGIELNTLSNSIPYRWEFKMSYTRETISPPQTTSDTQECPSDYTYWRGSCYKYFPWVYRHYQDQYNWQQTWQKSLAHCETVENGTLVAIRDEDEAAFLKLVDIGTKRVSVPMSFQYRWYYICTWYMFSTAWFWDRAGTVQSNGRLVFIGLHNKYGRYEWTDGSQLSYADWYVPPKAWEQSILFEDTIGTDFLDLKNPQPTADVGSVCSALLVKSPFASLSWTKVPCDFPIFRSGLICQKSATLKSGLTATVPEIVLRNETRVIVCPDGWFMIQGACLQLLTNYDAVRNPLTSDPWRYDNSTQQCGSLGAVVARVDDHVMSTLRSYLQLWRHDTTTGHVWVKRDDAVHRIIRVTTKQPQDEVIHYSLDSFTDNDNVEEYPRNVLCQISHIVREERCRSQEFRCGDHSCINRDGVCDGVIDCPDMIDEQNCECSENTFQCDDGHCISISLYCDFHSDCKDGSDEEHCVIRECYSDEFRCNSGQCIPESKMCDFKTDCKDGTDEGTLTCDGRCRGMQCFSGTCIPASLRADLISDCPGLTAEDEVERSTLTFFEIYKGGLTYDNETTHMGCDEGDTFVQCREEEPRCYPRSSTCIYDTLLVDDGADLQIQTTCRDGAHLRNLCGDIECPGMFHCPASYCIPHRKVCDGLRDCPDGSDELNCHNYTCPGLFRCKGEQFCISHSEVCDGTVHCPKYGDDEKYCYDLPGNSDTQLRELCSSGCQCIGHVIDCTGTNQTELLNVGVRAADTKALLLAHNQFRLESYSLLYLRSLGRLVLSYNHLEKLPPGLFIKLQNLYDLDLSFNMIVDLQPAAFEGLVSLRRLNLNHNALLSLTRETLMPLVQVSHLIITDNILSDVRQNVFEGVPSVRELNSDAYKFCCIAPQADVCTPEPDEFSSCEDLMANYTLQMAVWVLGIIACVGNGFVIIWRIKEKTKLISSFFIINLGISDFLMGVYMLIIGSVDSYYRGEYIVYADSWTSSALCQFSGILVMLSSEFSVFMLTAITADRVMNILFPLKMGNMRMRYARLLVLIGWCVCLFISILPATGIPYFGDSFFGRSGVCLPFQVTNKKLPGWEYSVFIFLVVNLISFVMIFIGYAGIFMKVKKSITDMKDKSTSTADEYALAKKLVIIVATDMLCWVPIILIGFAALGGAKISPQVSAWIAVFILPLNSAVNPLLYTISALDCRKNKKPKSRAGMSGKTGSTVVSAGRSVLMRNMSIAKMKDAATHSPGTNGHSSSVENDANDKAAEHTVTNGKERECNVINEKATQDAATNEKAPEFAEVNQAYVDNETEATASIMDNQV